MEKFSDKWFMEYALKSLKKKENKPKKLVRCCNCKHCVIGTLGDLSCTKECIGEKWVTYEGFIEYALSRHQSSAKRYCEQYEA